MFKILKSQDQKSDEELVQQFRKSGNRLLLGLLLKRYTESILGTCHYYLRQPQDAEDAATKSTDAGAKEASPAQGSR